MLLQVWWDSAVVGALARDEFGDVRFSYDSNWLADPRRPAISQSMPKRAEPFTRQEGKPFFGGILPEGRQREQLSRRLGVSEDNEFSFLERLGGDVAGALQFLPGGAMPQDPEGPFAPKVLDEEALAAVIDELPRRPLMAGEGGARLSLAGAQGKVPIVLVEGDVAPALALPSEGQPSTHILKPAIPEWPGTAESEALVMGTAAKLGLEVAPVELRAVRGADGARRAFLVVTRYDRMVRGARVARLHQEDFCQALGVLSDRKYQKEGGPSFRQAFRLLNEVSIRPAEDRLRLLDVALFNVLVGNADAHGKNFSLLYEGEGPRLAPFYDLMCTEVYPGLSRDFAMRIGSASHFDELRLRDWNAFAVAAGVNASFLRKRVAEMATSVPGAVKLAADALSGQGHDEGAIHAYVVFIQNRASGLLHAIRQGL